MCTRSGVPPCFHIMFNEKKNLCKERSTFGRRVGATYKHKYKMYIAQKDIM